MGDSPDDLLTTTAAAKVLGCSVNMVRYLADHNFMPTLRTTNGRRLFRRADVDDVAAQRALMPNPWPHRPFRRAA